MLVDLGVALVSGRRCSVPRISGSAVWPVRVVALTAVALVGLICQGVAELEAPSDWFLVTAMVLLHLGFVGVNRSLVRRRDQACPRCRGGLG